jgi:hypothetical protein
VYESPLEAGTGKWLDLDSCGMEPLKEVLFHYGREAPAGTRTRDELSLDESGRLTITVTELETQRRLVEAIPAGRASAPCNIEKGK